MRRDDFSFAGTGRCGYGGDGGRAIDGRDNLFIVDSLNFAVRKIDPVNQVITTVIGMGNPGITPAGGAAEYAYLGGSAHEKGTTGGGVPHAADVDAEGNLYIAETGLNRIRVADAVSGKIFTVAGTGTGGLSGDGGPALKADLCVHGLRSGPDGSLYFVDFHHHVVRKIVFPGRNSRARTAFHQPPR